MASITKKPSSRYYHACYRLPDGRQKRVSTKTEDKSRALRIAHALESAVSESRSGAMTRGKVQSLVEEICAIAQVDMQAAVSVRDLITIYWAGNPVDERWTKARLRILAQVARCWPVLIDRPATSVDSQNVVELRAFFLALGNSASTTNQKLATLGSAFADGHRRGDLPRNPFDGVRVKNPKHARQRRRNFTAAHAAQLIEATDGEWRVLVAIGYYTGQRQQQCAKIPLGDINFERDLVRFPASKHSANEHVVPLHGNLRKIILAYMEEHPEIGPDDYLLPDLASRRSRGSMSISGQFRDRILPKIGIIQPYHKRDPDAPGRRTIAPYQFHSLRHALASVLSDRGVPESVRMQILGHASKDVHLGYTHTDIETARKALDQI